MRKGRILVGLILCIALVLTVGLALAAEPDFGVAYRSNTVNLRRGPNKNTDRLASYAAGTWVQINGSSGNWYSVKCPDGLTGYISKNYIETPKMKRGIVGYVSNHGTGEFLNLRARPSYEAEVIGTYRDGAPCVVQEYRDGWYRVRIDGRNGYFRGEYLSTTPNAVYGDSWATILTPMNTGLNLRSGPGMNYASLGLYGRGRYVMVLQKGTDWWRVAVDGVVGFMKSSYLTPGLVDSGMLPAGQESTGEPYGLVNNPSRNQVLNLRSEASATSASVGKYINGTRVRILQQGLEWCRVQVVKTGATGYMMTRYLKLYNCPKTPRMTVRNPTGSYVNLRATPSMNGSVIKRLDSGTTVSVVAWGDEWVRVRDGSRTGYVMRIFLQ